MGGSEWLVILAVAVLLFVPRRAGRSVGGWAASFRDAARDDARQDTRQDRHEDARDDLRNERTRLLALLELPADATTEQVQQAWRELAKVWHPDRFGHDPALQARATSRLAAINAAYERLRQGERH